jgi:hypothetical protein
MFINCSSSIRHKLYLMDGEFSSYGVNRVNGINRKDAPDFVKSTHVIESVAKI